jgi:hypothetical protein
MIVRCIYCLKFDQGTDSEHVIPRCAIKSIKHAPALHGEVCANCNNVLGHVDSIAVPLTLTAVLTALDGANTKYAGMEDFGVSHYCIRLRANEMKLLNGARCFVSSSAAHGYTMHLESRIALLKHDNGFDLVHPERLERLAPRSAERTFYTGEAIFVGFDQKTSLSKLPDSLRVRPLSELERQWAISTMRAGFEDQLGRAVAKMAFNFLAWIAGRSKYHRHSLDLYGQKFDALRAAIVQQKAPDKPYVKRSGPEFERTGRREHFIRLKVERGQLVAEVGLFDMARWRVALAEIEESDFPYDVQYAWDFELGGCSGKRRAEKKGPDFRRALKLNMNHCCTS